VQVLVNVKPNSVEVASSSQICVQMDLHVWWSLKEVRVPILVYFFLSVDIEVPVGVDRDQHLSDVRLRTKKKIQNSISPPQILEKKWEYNKTVHQLFVDFKKAYDSVRREVLYNIVTRFTRQRDNNNVDSLDSTRKFI
jgi:hypothetical protein